MRHLLTKQIDDASEQTIATSEDDLALLLEVQKDLQQHIEESEQPNCRKFHYRIYRIIVDMPIDTNADGKKSVSMHMQINQG